MHIRMLFHFHGDKQVYHLDFNGTEVECIAFKTKARSDGMGFVEDIVTIQEGATTFSSSK